MAATYITNICTESKPATITALKGMHALFMWGLSNVTVLSHHHDKRGGNVNIWKIWRCTNVKQIQTHMVTHIDIITRGICNLTKKKPREDKLKGVFQTLHNV